MKEGYVLKKVTELMAKRDWSLYRLAKESGISYSTLNNSFHRDNVPSVPTIMRVCDGFGITLSEFFNEGGSTVKHLTAGDRQFIENFHKLPRDDKKLLIAYMKGLLESVETGEDDSEPAETDGDDGGPAETTEE